MLMIRLTPRQQRMLNPKENGAQTRQEIIKSRKHPNQYSKRPKRKKNPLRQIKSKATKHSFSETPLGSYLQRYCPVEYELVLEAKKAGVSITADIVEEVVDGSNNPMCKTSAFRKALGDYRRYKCSTPNSNEINTESECLLIRKYLGLD